MLKETARLGEIELPPDPESAKNSMEERQHAFVLRVRTSKDGNALEGTCISRIAGTDDRLRMGRIRARLCGGVAYDWLDQETRSLIDAKAVLAVTLVEYPEWLDGILNDRPDVLLSVYEEVRRHEAVFFRIHDPQSGQEKKPPMVQIIPIPGAVELPEEFQWQARTPEAGTAPRRGPGGNPTPPR